MANPFAHIELTTNDLGKAKKFYKAIFDWKLEDVKGMPYTMIKPGKGPGGGMQPKPMPEAPTQWLPYVEVADVKKTLEKVRKAGGSVMLDYMDIGAMGSIGIFMDPTGVGLGIWAAGKKPAKKAAKKGAKKAAKKR